MTDLPRQGTFPHALVARRASAREVAAHGAVARGIKRAMDVAVASVGLVALSPILLLIGLAVRLESPGPALFRQVRLGRDARPFVFYKFRTMRDGIDSDIHRDYVEKLITHPSEDLKGDTGSFKIEDDPRLTRMGRLLRRTSLDELPQLLNVLVGEMSLVGPRPPLAYEVELYSERARRRLECTPGLTGLWQVSGRCLTTFEEMVDLDIEYIDTWSLGLDLAILVRTVPAVVSGRGAW